MERSLNAAEMMAIRIALLAAKDQLRTLMHSSEDPYAQAAFRARLETIQSLSQTFRPGQQVRVEEDFPTGPPLARR